MNDFVSIYHEFQPKIQREMNTCIRETVNRLPHDFKTVLVLSEFEELKDNEIAEILRISLQTVKIRLHRARTKLRETFESRCTFYRDERTSWPATGREKSKRRKASSIFRSANP